MIAGLDSYHNIAYRWNIDELFDAHEALDIKSEIEQHSMGNRK